MRNLTKAMFEIYGIVDPRSDAVFYIGSSTDATGRLKSHIGRAIAGEAGPRPTTIRAIVSSGKHPVLKVLKTVRGVKAARMAELVEMENHSGGPLTNGAFPISALRAKRPHKFKLTPKESLYCDEISGVVTITANVTEAVLREARMAAIDAGKSLRVFAGELLTKAIREPRAKKA